MVLSPKKFPLGPKNLKPLLFTYFRPQKQNKKNRIQNAFTIVEISMLTHTHTHTHTFQIYNTDISKTCFFDDFFAYSKVKFFYYDEKQKSGSITL
jgi:hypothetical protein